MEKAENIQWIGVTTLAGGWNMSILLRWRRLRSVDLEDLNSIRYLASGFAAAAEVGVALEVVGWFAAAG